MHPTMNRRDEEVKPTILVVDEDVLSLELYARELSSDYQVIACEHIEEAQRFIQNPLLAAVILEPATNDGDGWLLLEEVRSFSSSLPVIVCSVLDERKVGLEKAADAFLVKPVLPTTLHHMIDQIVMQKKAKSDHLSSAR